MANDQGQMADYKWQRTNARRQMADDKWQMKDYNDRNSSRALILGKIPQPSPGS
jgi:hypothetical protein